ncbi:hypothetical protein GGX14DRAFT_389500 [Mycena pura]|uniref:Uncharacterized protein n=1 Tax=Mycena pura TaxID=153505 RepID=A0AAD6VUE4_9AGAR|nr:hypothetical protein GGX14DRAFT_389500 [Mycena pura]
MAPPTLLPKSRHQDSHSSIVTSSEVPRPETSNYPHASHTAGSMQRATAGSSAPSPSRSPTIDGAADPARQDIMFLRAQERGKGHTRRWVPEHERAVRARVETSRRAVGTRARSVGSTLQAPLALETVAVCERTAARRCLRERGQNLCRGATRRHSGGALARLPRVAEARRGRRGGGRGTKGQREGCGQHREGGAGEAGGAMCQWMVEESVMLATTVWSKQERQYPRPADTALVVTVTHRSDLIQRVM